MNYWIITVKEPYCGYILRGLKKIEIRKTTPSTLRLGDVIFIVRKGEKGHIVGACRVISIMRGTVEYFSSEMMRSRHCLKSSEIKEYAGQRKYLDGIEMQRIDLDTWCLNVRSFGFERPPQNFYRINPAYMSTIERVQIK